MEDKFGAFVRSTVIDFIEDLSENTFSEISIQIPGVKLLLKREEKSPVFIQSFSPSPSDIEENLEPSVVQPVKDKIEEIKSKWVGVFYYSGNKPLRKGDRVETGQLMGTVRSMNLVFEVISSLEGEIAEVLISNKKNVEYGKVLFKIKKKEA